MNHPEDGHQKRAVAAEIIRRTADAVTDATLIDDWIRRYREKMPVKDIAQAALDSAPDTLSSLPLDLVAGVVRTKIRELVPLEERKEIEAYHRRKGQESTHVMQRTRAGGKKSGQLHLERGTGFFGLDSGTKEKNASAGGVAFHIAMGHTPWSPANQLSNGMSEHELCMHLPNSAQFQHKEGRTKGKPNNQAIADELNRIFHEGKPVRKARNVNVRRSMHKNT